MKRILLNEESVLVEGDKITLEIKDGDLIYQCNDKCIFYSKFGINQVIKMKIKDSTILATVRGVHFYEDKVKYDLALWLGDGSVDDPEWESRIYNVDSILVEAV